MSATLTRTPISSRAATRRGRRGQRRSCCKYAAGDYNALHQDLYGEHVFPLQLTILLSSRKRDFTGGEFVLTEQRPRMQSRARWCRYAGRRRGVRGAPTARCTARAEPIASLSGTESAAAIRPSPTPWA